MRVTQTHTVALLQLSPEAYKEISDKLEAAGYQHAFSETDGVKFIDMSGIGVTAQEPDPVAGHYPMKMAGDHERLCDRVRDLEDELAKVSGRLVAAGLSPAGVEDVANQVGVLEIHYSRIWHLKTRDVFPDEIDEDPVGETR